MYRYILVCTNFFNVQTSTYQYVQVHTGTYAYIPFLALFKKRANRSRTRNLVQTSHRVYPCAMGLHTSSWTVASDEFYAGYCFTSVGEHSPTPTWSLRMCHSTSQLELTGLVQYIMHRRRWGPPRVEPNPHPWQIEPPLPVNVTIDISHHHPRSLSAPVGW